MFDESFREIFHALKFAKTYKRSLGIFLEIIGTLNIHEKYSGLMKNIAKASKAIRTQLNQIFID